MGRSTIPSAVAELVAEIPPGALRADPPSSRRTPPEDVVDAAVAQLLIDAADRCVTAARARIRGHR
jgi:hypothetical protein